METRQTFQLTPNFKNLQNVLVFSKTYGIVMVF